VSRSAGPLGIERCERSKCDQEERGQVEVADPTNERGKCTADHEEASEPQPLVSRQDASESAGEDGPEVQQVDSDAAEENPPKSRMLTATARVPPARASPCFTSMTIAS
jgi:hypothetical protein